MMNCTLKLIPALFALLSTAAFAADGLFSTDGAVTTVGGGIAVGPRYSGSDENMVSPMLAVDYALASGFYASSLRGLGYGASVGPFSYGAALGYRAARKENGKQPFGSGRASKYLRGMGDVQGAATANLSVGYAIFDGLNVNLHTALALSNRESGNTYGAGLSGMLVKSDSDTVTLNVGFELADGKYAQSYYGVTAQQAVKSGYKVYKPKSGVYQADVTMSWQHKIDAHWGVTGMLGVTGLLRDAANSPLVRRTTSPTAAVYASYAF
jgi:outer membrane protein